MAIEMRAGDGLGDEEIIDAEIVDDEEDSTPGRRVRLGQAAARRREQAGTALTGQRRMVKARIAAWFRTDDITDAELAEEVEQARRQRHQAEEAHTRHQIAGLKRQLAQYPDRAASLAVQLTAAEVRLDALRGTDSADRYKVTDLGRARWMKKAKRVALALGGCVVCLAAGAQQPGLFLLEALGAATGWWYLSRPVTGPHASAAQNAATGPSAPVSLVKTPPPGGSPAATGAAAPAPAPGEAFVPDTLAAAGRTSLVKRDPAHVRGETDLVTALVKAGIITEAQRDETHLAGVIQPAGPGWTATVELPRGLKASAAISKVADLASALRIKKSRIEVSADTSEDGHEGRFVLWVADEDNPFGTAKHPSELITADRWDFWQQGIPLGADARRSRHTLHLLWFSLLIGGLMGYGKSYLARLAAAAAALDPTVRVIVITGKTGPDWAPLRHLAHKWIAGASPEIIREVLRVMDHTISEMQDRGSDLDRLYEENPDAVPEGKITPELAADGMGPVLLLVDELQELLDGAALVQIPVDEDRDPDAGGRPKTRSGRDLMVESFARYVRVTRFVGGMGVFITQRPDADSVPTKLREVCAKRASFRVKGDRSAKMVLGDDAVAAGAAPHLLTEASRGVAVLDQGSDEGHVTLKADVIDLPDFKEICLRGRQLREDAGTLTGDAVDYGTTHAAATAAADLLTDCLTVMDTAGVDRVRTAHLVDLLQQHQPGRYGELTTTSLQAQLRAAGAGTTVKLGALDGMANPNGYRREQIASAARK